MLKPPPWATGRRASLSFGVFTMSMAITIRGSFRGYSGYDCTIRSLVRHLAQAGALIGLIDLPHWSPVKLPDELLAPWFTSLERLVESDVVVHCCMPHQVLRSPGRWNVNLTMFEATPAPRAWIEDAASDLVIAPTDSSLDAWVAAGASRDLLRLCPLGVDGDRFRPGLEPLDLVDRRGVRATDYRVRVLNVSDLVPRKNLLALLRVWLRNTHRDDDAVLILKLSHSRHSAVRLLRDLHLMERKLGKLQEEAASILLFVDILSDADMPRLYATATHYWSMSCGEGWDQPMTEAGASGLQLIAPNHSAYQAYLDDHTASLIPSRLEPVPPDNHNPDISRFFQGAMWWRPDEDAAAEAISLAVAGRDERRSARPRLVREFGWGRTASELITIVGELRSGGAARSRTNN